MSINPIKLIGPWKDGYSLDRHTISSVYIGDDEYGHPRYDTTRSEIGELIYLLKYVNDIKVLESIIELAKPFLMNKWGIQRLVNLIVPIPPTNTGRRFQPVFELCKAFGYHLGVPINLDVLSKQNTTQLKDLRGTDKKKVLAEAIHLNKSFRSKMSILLIDDLYDSGATIETSTRVLHRDVNVDSVYVLTMTKTRGN
mgnify:CR=1 FL=1